MNYIKAVLILVLVLTVTYAGSFFVFTEKITPQIRVCDIAWMSPLFRPLVTLEESITGESIYCGRDWVREFLRTEKPWKIEWSLDVPYRQGDIQLEFNPTL